MPGIIVIGLQWGDEGKGKVVDLFSRSASHIVRSQGGCNAGHTIVDGDQEWALHHIPSGILRPRVHCYIAGGCVIDPQILIEEMQRIESSGIEIVERLHLSPYAHLVMPHHKQLDALAEQAKGDEAIGTTKRGIGPCIADRASRIGLRMADLIRSDSFESKLRVFVERKNRELSIYGSDPITFEAVLAQYAPYGELLRSFVSDVEGRLHDASIRDETILLEGAHGTLLDTVVGSYPYVTSSSTLAAGVCAGAGLGPNQVDEVIGVLKAYTTRVGEGPLPTAIEGDFHEDFEGAAAFRETGTTTGRKRRIGWLDLVLAKHAIALNGVGSLALTKLDVFDDFPEIKVCTGYRFGGQEIDRPPPLSEDLALVEPIYEVLPGWQTSTKEVTRIRGLPEEARAFIDLIEEVCNTPIGMVSVGPERQQTIEIDEEWM